MAKVQQFLFRYSAKILWYTIGVSVVLKMALASVLRVINPPDWPAIYWGELNALQALNVGVLERLDNFSFWNWVAAAWAVHWIVLGAKDSLETKNSGIFMGRKATFFWALLATTFTTIYMAMIASNASDFEGAFFCASPYVSVRSFEIVEGCINLLFCLVPTFFIVQGVLIVQKLTSATRTLEFVLNAGFIPALPCLLAYQIITTKLVGEMYPGAWPVNPSIPPGDLAIAILVWYGAYSALSAYTLRRVFDTCGRPQVMLLGKLPFPVWLKLKRRDLPDDANRSSSRGDRVEVVQAITS